MSTAKSFQETKNDDDDELIFRQKSQCCLAPAATRREREPKMMALRKAWSDFFENLEHCEYKYSAKRRRSDFIMLL